MDLIASVSLEQVKNVDAIFEGAKGSAKGKDVKTLTQSTLTRTL